MKLFHFITSSFFFSVASPLFVPIVFLVAIPSTLLLCPLSAVYPQRSVSAFPAGNPGEAEGGVLPLTLGLNLFLTRSTLLRYRRIFTSPLHDVSLICIYSYRAELAIHTHTHKEFLEFHARKTLNILNALHNFTVLSAIRG